MENYNHHHDFIEFLKPYHSDLARYCRMLAGTPWDADDLFQETLIKVFQSFAVLQEHPAPKAYLFRVATNAWIDYCRKNKVPLDTYEEERVGGRSEELAYEVRPALEELLCLLPPRQVSVLLLIDVFGFTGRSAADLMNMTEGSLKSALHRAKTTLKQVKDHETEERSRLKLKSVSELVDIFLEAFHRHDSIAISRAYHSLKYHGVEVRRILRNGVVSFHFTDPDGHIFTVIA